MNIEHDEEYLYEHGAMSAPGMADKMKAYHEHMMQWRSMDEPPKCGEWVEILCDKLGHIHTIAFRPERTKETDLGWRPALPLNTKQSQQDE